MKTTRILITGWRHATQAHGQLIHRTLEEIAFNTGLNSRVIVVHGACRYGGVDHYAEQWATNSPYGIPEAHPAESFGGWPSCGPKRNSHMVSLGADLCLGFPGPNSRGTWDCLRKAVDAGIPTRVVALVERDEVPA